MPLIKHWVVSLCALAFLAASVLGTHMHLCFDGQEPPSSLHVLDGEHLDHHAGEAQAHDDLDVDLLGEPLLKTFKLDLPVLALLAACFLLMPTRAATLPLPARRIAVPLPLPRHWRPLLRAPPL